MKGLELVSSQRRPRGVRAEICWTVVPITFLRIKPSISILIELTITRCLRIETSSLYASGGGVYETVDIRIENCQFGGEGQNDDPWMRISVAISY